MENPIGNADELPEDEKRRVFERLKELVPLAKDRLLESQRRYKEKFDLHKRVANHKISPEPSVFLRREVADPNGSSKLDELADGPYRVVKSEGHTRVLRIGDDDVRVSKNRVTQAPRPLAAVPIAGDSPVANPMGNFAPPTGNDPIPTDNDSPEFFIDKIVGLRKADDGTWSYKVRWYGYTAADDTWEPSDHLPGNMVRRYHRRVGISLNN
jgi:Chromo (CHRromatin Organisation MOdifier) domain